MQEPDGIRMLEGSSVPEYFTGYACFGSDTYNKFELYNWTPRPFRDYDIDVKVEYCGICGSDLHTLRAGWGPVKYPIVCGHEVSGRAIRVGPKVTSIQPGDYVGIGAMSWSCGKCSACAGPTHPVSPCEGDDGEHGYGGEGGLDGGNEQYCKRVCELYNWDYPGGGQLQGGFANYVRIHENFCFPIPDSIPPELAAPMLCGGVTMYSALTRSSLPKDSKIGIIGLGGLGHFAVLFGSTDYDISVLSHSPSKEADSLKLGASRFISTDSNSDWPTQLARNFDLVICTNHSTSMPLQDYLKTLKIGGTLMICGIPEGTLPPLSWADLGASNLAIKGSNVGSKKEVISMLKLASEKNLKPWVEVLDMKHLGDAITRLEKGDCRYRFVMKADFE
ncbi:GroES-like protein [Ascobolus immersus RN42]|uniref:GroES-like protein n=1 Tax=Ascobolus immersus RN42 TaxID=1160509 RepID=A0A3N4IQA9_ASCIM|nr:GroES-like protein [Ascobolus immersus RN42]